MANLILAKRDPYLDYLRGIAIIWVVLVHVFYHKQFIPPGSLGEAFRAVMLFEMPLLFFVSGASLYHAHYRWLSIRAFLIRRLRRLISPYLFLAVACSGLFYLKGWMAGSPLSLNQMASWLLLEPWPVVPVYVGFSMWFVRVMLAVTLLHPILIRLFLSDSYRMATAILLVVAVVAFTPFERPMFYNAVPWHQLPQYTVFYGAFVYLGYYYADGRLLVGAPQLALLLGASVAVLAVLAGHGFVYADAQLNKFPPNVGYGLLGVAWLAFWLLLRPMLLLAAGLKWFGGSLRFFSGHSYTVFLYHGFGFAMADFVFSRLFHFFSVLLGGAHYSVSILVYFFLVLVLTTVVVVTVDRMQAMLSRVRRFAAPFRSRRAAESNIS